MQLIMKVVAMMIPGFFVSFRQQMAEGGVAVPRNQKTLFEIMI